MKLKILFILITYIGFLSCPSNEPVIKQPTSEIYFPQVNSDIWETKRISSLRWNQSELKPLLDHLELKNTKSFMTLHEGKIVLEVHMNGHTNNLPWYWTSAGKTLTSIISGIAQQEEVIDINNKVLDYLVTGWTSAPLEKEDLITCKNLLSMNSGLDDSLKDDVSPSNLQYVADTGTRWAYHNAYVKMQDIVVQVSNQTWGNYFNAKLRDKIGMTGSWVLSNNLSIYWSNTRSMARFGLMIYVNGMWGDTKNIDSNYLNEAKNTSQNINQAYGYL